jgi:hypothetical protein
MIVAQTAVTKKTAMNWLFVQNAVETPNLGVSTSKLFGRNQNYLGVSISILN